jgi:hypothetical protein
LRDHSLPGLFVKVGEVLLGLLAEVVLAAPMRELFGRRLLRLRMWLRLLAGLRSVDFTRGPAATAVARIVSLAKIG